ncbi:MAG: polymerase sigma factor RpoE [Myxococcales bacterium]|nr:polymerase sigma factor RpoE [Myxococcales bacterium]
MLALTNRMPSLALPLEAVTGVVVPSFDEVYAAHFAFVWRVLRTFGVPESSLEDAAQDVFVVVHRRLPEFEGRAAITTWLFAIARRIAGPHRRRVDRAAEQLAEELPGPTDTFAALSRAQAAATVMAILETMDEDKRIVFALVELEQLSVPDVSRMLEINLNTAYSRLRLARQAFEAAVRSRVTP